MINTKCDKLHFRWKGYENSFNSWIDMKDIKLSEYFPGLYGRSRGNVKIKLVLSNYAKKANLKGAISIDTSKLVSKRDLASLKTKVDNLDIDKHKTVFVT